MAKKIIIALVIGTLICLGIVLYLHLSYPLTITIKDIPEQIWKIK